MLKLLFYLHHDQLLPFLQYLTMLFLLLQYELTKEHVLIHNYILYNVFQILVLNLFDIHCLLILLLPFVLGSCAIGISYEVEFPPKIKESLTPEEETEKGE